MREVVGRSTWYFSGKPSIPGRVNSEDLGNVVREKSAEGHANGELVGIWFARSLEPNRIAGCFDPQEAELGTGIELSKPAGRAEAQWLDSALNPAQEMLKPTGFGKWALLGTCDMAVEILNPTVNYCSIT